MALRHAILATLLDGESSGYELSKWFDPAVPYFWHCAAQQLYAELTRLEAAGLTTGREVVQDRRPNKRVYTLTEAGHDELTRFVTTASKPSFIRDDLLVKVYTAEAGDAEVLVEQLEERAAELRARIAWFDELLARLRGGRSEQEFLADGERIGRYLAAVRGQSFERDNLAWCVWAERVLRARALGEQPPAFPSAGTPAGPERIAG